MNKRRVLVLFSALIEYPGVGLILYETGCAEDLGVVCRPILCNDCSTIKQSIAMACTCNGCISAN